MLGDALTFFGIILVLTFTPGADMALVMRHVLAHGFSSTWATLAGIFSGLVIHVTLCVAGLSVILRQSEAAFATVKFAGAAWLLWMGFGALLAAVRARSAAVTEAPTGRALDEAHPVNVGGVRPMPRTRTLYMRGLLTNLLNVKIALFYIAFLPQFAPSGPAFVPVALGLAIIQGAIGFAWLLTYALIVARAGRAVDASPRMRVWLEAVTGIALVAFGLRLAAASR